MFASRQNIHTPAPDPENISILIATPDAEDLNTLRQLLPQRDGCLSLSTSVSDAAEKAATLEPAILICERELPDGNWKDVLDRLQSIIHPPLLLVVSRLADESLWAEVLSLGGYDVLLKPFDRSEVTRVIGMAWRQWVSVNDQSPVAGSALRLTPQFAA